MPVVDVVGLFRDERIPLVHTDDRAVGRLGAEHLMERGFRNSDHELLPTYFSLGPSFNLNGVSVYLQVIPYLDSNRAKPRVAIAYRAAGFRSIRPVAKTA